jgi:hypothetical protein
MYSPTLLLYIGPYLGPVSRKKKQPCDGEIYFRDPRKLPEARNSGNQMRNGIEKWIFC